MAAIKGPDAQANRTGPGPALRGKVRAEQITNAGLATQVDLDQDDVDRGGEGLHQGRLVDAGAALQQQGFEICRARSICRGQEGELLPPAPWPGLPSPLTIRWRIISGSGLRVLIRGAISRPNVDWPLGCTRIVKNAPMEFIIWNTLSYRVKNQHTKKKI